MTNSTLNPFVITWAILTPIKGKPTKRDAQNGFGRCGNVLARHAANIDNAKESVKSLKLNKKYTLTFITDKQFGLVGKDLDFSKVFTAKQISEQTIIG